MYKNAVVNSSSSFVAVLVVLLLFVTSWRAVVRCEEIVRGKVTEALSMTSVHSVSGPGEPLPPSLRVDIRLGGQELHLHLARDSGFDPRLPVHVLSTDSLGTLQSRRVRLNDTEFALYQDIRNEGVFGVSRMKDANGTSRYKLQGLVHSEGLVYNINTKDPHLPKPRLRRSALDADDDDNNKNANDSSPADNNEEADEEFEVEVFTEAAADGTDSLPAPPNRAPLTKNMTPEDPLPVASIPSTPSPLHLPLRSPSRPPPVQGRGRERRRSGRRRQGTQDVYVDVVALVDYGVYTTWYGRSTGTTSSEKQQNTLQDIRRYYAIVMNGVNLLYQTVTSESYSINVRLVGIVVSTTGNSSRWTEQYRVPRARWDSVDASSVLESLRAWAATTDALPAYDHLMLFTGYDLSKTVGGVFSTGTTGLAYTGTVCGTEGQAVSLVEDLGAFQCTVTAAHELGHGLSAEHDGTKNTCRSEDRYVMSAGTYATTPTNTLNPWRFSTCSVTYFTVFVRDTLSTARGRQCLNNALAVSANVPDASSLVPGQLYSPDEQCRQVYGPESRLCRGSEFGSAADVCTAMFCFDPSTTATCVKLVAARGTTCGNQQWCQGGQCVTNAAAPVADDSCVFGDQPGEAFQGEDCAAFVGNFSGYCYQDVVRTRCCSSCAKHRHLLSGCLYGDKAAGCSSGACSFADVNYLQSCCGTCNYGTPFTTTPPITLPTSPSGCQYGDRDSLRCAEARQNGEACSTLQSVCCKTCAGYGTTAHSSSVVVIPTAFPSLVAAAAAVWFLVSGVL